MSLTGPSRTIVVEPLERPQRAPAPPREEPAPRDPTEAPRQPTSPEPEHAPAGT